MLTKPDGFGILTFVDETSSSVGELCNGSTYDSDSYCLGSNPSSPATRLHGQAVKTLPSQGRIMGSIPIGGAKEPTELVPFFVRLQTVEQSETETHPLCGWRQKVIQIKSPIHYNRGVQPLK